MSWKICAALAPALLVACATADAALFDQDITPDAIFGDGNANGAWTVDRSNNVELGLRAKLRFNAANDPENTFNSNGDGTYTFRPGLPPGGGFGNPPNFSSSTATWNFEWSINSDLDGSSGRVLDALRYAIEIDFDPGPGVSPFLFDPINIIPVPGLPDFGDHAIGDNGTGNGEGVEAIDRPDYLNLIANNNVAQNSWNLDFFDSAVFPFDPRVPGEYTFRLSAFEGLSLIARTQITVNVVPEPSALVLTGVGLAAVAGRRKRR